MGRVTELCPWCGSTITRDKFLEIEARIRSEEQKKLVDAETELRKRIEVETQEAQKRANEEAQKQVALIAAERDAVRQQVKEFEVRETALKERLENERLEAEKHANEQAQKQLAILAAERDSATKRMLESEAREADIRAQTLQDTEKNLETIREEFEQRKQKELDEQRAILENDRDQVVLKKQAEFVREREALQKKIMEMDRQLQRKTANEFGDGAEIDLLENLRAAFPNDRITRIQKGQPGADIKHEILHKGEVCGSIVYDSKNRQAWQFTFVEKLREDQLEAGADHAVLSTSVFPSGKKELCIESDIVVVNPARAVHIVYLLRQALLGMHLRGLSMKERAQKTDRLYKFITSRSYSQRFDQLTELTDNILELDVQEKRTHDGVWKRRGKLLMQQSGLLREIDTDISAIVEGTDQSASAA
jgi:hypothetical protein